ncbi:uncharacterized protein J3D65DRAFT_648387 [Phyllosticta citribraziliensis]|uniref:Uncharacterized protein n=1 Tax=Phyllosticta citribraziliensis TaxID=989973 RepID=A0ABR1L4W0_9PEZI
MTSPTSADGRLDEEYARANPSKFRFKSKCSRRECDDDDLDHHRSRRRKHSEDGTDSSRHDHDQHRRRHHRRHHGHHRSRRQETPSQAAAEPVEEEPLSPNTAFRLSLFDAMADDEGALFWEGVYGQPIHTYPRPDGSPSAEDAGFLESMTDEEYAEYVRTKMWEKTHQHVIEERERRERDKERRKAEEKRYREEGARKEREGEEFRRRVEESLRRGETRRQGKKWKSVWEAYLKRWDDIAAGKNNTEEESRGPKDLLPWPVESGKMRHVGREEVERFWLNVPIPEGELMDTLKRERVRWHPDKIQQRFGGGANEVDETTMKAVTAIFQVVDRLWGEMRDKAKD